MRPAGVRPCTGQKRFLNVRDITYLAKRWTWTTIRDVLENQITCNRAISDTGLAGHYGAEVGATLLRHVQEGL